MATSNDILRHDSGDLQRHRRTVAHQGVAYPGEVVVARQWQPQYVHPLAGDTYFLVLLLREGQPVPTLPLPDSRIVVCIPGQDVSRQRGDIGQELRTLREASATYLARRDPQIAGLRHSLEEQAQDMEKRLLEQEAHAYAAGRVVTQLGPQIVASEAFTRANAEAWVVFLAQAVLARSYPRLPLDGSLFPRPLQAEDVPLLFDGLFAPEKSPAGVSLVQLFGPGLGLAPGIGPRMVDAANCRGIELLATELERRQGVVPGQSLLTLLAHGYGLTYGLATLFLLVYAHTHPAEVEIVLRPGHDVTLRNGRSLPGDRIVGDVVPDILWPAQLLDQVVEVRQSARLSWNAVLPYAAVLDPSLSSAEDPQGVSEQTKRLLDALIRLQERATAATQTVAQLASSLGTEPDPSVQECLHRLQQVAAAQSYQDLYARAASLYHSVGRLQEDLDQLRQLEELAKHVSEIEAAALYLRAISLPHQYAEIEMDRQVLLGQMDLATLLHNPGRWEGLRSLFQWFRSRYASVYAQRHAAVQRDAAALAQDLAKAALKATALERLNAIPELGEPLGADALLRAGRLRESLSLCTIPSESLPLERLPLCPQCGLQLDQTLPQEEVEQALAELDAALDTQNRRLASRVVHKIAARRQEPPVERFIKAVQVSDLTGLANVLDDTLTSLIREML